MTDKEPRIRREQQIANQGGSVENQESGKEPQNCKSDLADQAKQRTIDELTKELEVFRSVEQSKEAIFTQIKQTIEEVLNNKLEQDRKSKELSKQQMEKIEETHQLLLQQKDQQIEFHKKKLTELKETLEHEKNNKEERFKQKESELVNLQTQIAVLLEKHTKQLQSVETRMELQCENKWQKLIEQEKQSHRDKIISAENENLKKQRDCEKLMKQRDEAVNKNIQLEQKLQQTNQKLIQLTLRNQQLSSLAQELKRTNSSLQAEKDQFGRKVQSTEANYALYKDNIEKQLKQLQQQWNKQHEQLKKYYEQQIKICHNTHQKSVEEISKLREMTTQKDQQIQTHQQILRKLTSQKKNIQKDNQDSQARVRTLESVCSEIKSSLNQPQLKDHQLPTTIKTNLLSIQSLLQEARAEKDALKAQYDLLLDNETKALKEWIQEEGNNIQKEGRLSHPPRKRQLKLQILYSTCSKLLINVKEILKSKAGELAGAKEKNKILEKQLQNKSKESTDIHDEMVSLRSANNDMNIARAKYQLEIEALKIQHETELNSFKVSREALLADLADVRATLENSRRETVSLKAKLSQANVWKTEHDKLNLKKEKLETQLRQSEEDIEKLSQQVRLLEEQKKTLLQEIEMAEGLTKQSRLQSASDKQTMKKELRDLEKTLKEAFEKDMKEQAQKVNNALEKAMGSSPQDLNFDSIILFIKEKVSASTSGAFTVSELLEYLPKERAFLQTECCKFLGCSHLTTKLSFKYDQFSKNFQPYLPEVSRQFPFLILFRAKKSQHLFAVVATALSKEGKATALNISEMKIMRKNERTRIGPCTYDNSTLKFGNDEITIRNNWNPEVKVSTSIIGDKYFMFSLEDFIGKNERVPVLLETFEIHKLYPL